MQSTKYNGLYVIKMDFMFDSELLNCQKKDEYSQLQNYWAQTIKAKGNTATPEDLKKLLPCFLKNRALSDVMMKFLSHMPDGRANLFAGEASWCDPLNKGAQPRKSNKFGCFPTHQAVLSGSEECMEIILKFGEEHGYSRQLYINCVNNGKASPLHLAVQNGDLEIVKMCLDNGAQIDLVEGADINSIDSEGRSPLILATASASWNVVNLLLSKGTKRNQAK
ncbi:uncharacterized protein LOC144579711 isoform X1 [Callithrix jacchus]